MTSTFRSHRAKSCDSWGFYGAANSDVEKPQVAALVMPSRPSSHSSVEIPASLHLCGNLADCKGVCKMYRPAKLVKSSVSDISIHVLPEKDSSVQLSSASLPSSICLTFQASSAVQTSEESGTRYARVEGDMAFETSFCNVNKKHHSGAICHPERLAARSQNCVARAR